MFGGRVNGAPRNLATALAGVAFATVVGVAVSGQSRPPVEWRDYAGGPDSSRYSPLTQINKSNIDRLDVAWTYEFGDTSFNPIVANGVIYTVGRTNALVALDAATGKEIWVHDGLTGMTTRGVNYWESKDGRDRRLLFCVGDYLQAIDANTGKFIRSFGRDGVVDLREGLGRDPKLVARIQSGNPGKVFENLLLIGSATGEGYMAAPGDLRAFDVITGEQKWSFHTVPHPGEFGYDTFPKDAWKYIGGANTWGEISVDAARGIAYFPTGSPTYDYYGADRHGTNLFGSSLLALDARTGKRLWHYQMVHHDLWDFDNVAAPQLTTITQNGRRVDVVAMAGKTGYLYVFNRVTGAPIWPIEERPVPTHTEVPGEKVWPTQPIPTKPAPFGRLRFTIMDLNPFLLTDSERASYISRIVKARNDGEFTPIGFTETIHMPGNHGGANWGSTSAHPTDGTVYVTGLNVPAIIRLRRPDEPVPPGRGGGGPAGPGGAVYAANCQACHGPNREGTAAAPALVGVGQRLDAAQLRAAIVEGRGQMPAFHELSATDLEALVTFVATENAGGGRGAGPLPSYPPGPVVESGPAAPVREPINADIPYPEDAEAPRERFRIESYGLHPDIINPPYTTLTAYDLNKATIKWQIGLGDDPRLAPLGIKGTGVAQTHKGSVIPTAAGLLFANGGDAMLHVYDSDTGKQLLEVPLGGASSGSPSMYELNGRQYLLVTANTNPGRRGAGMPAGSPAPSGPKGLVAFTVK